MSNAGSRLVITLLLLVGVGLTWATPTVSAPRWVEEGPGPILNSPLTAVPPHNPASGAINAIAASRTNPDLVMSGRSTAVCGRQPMLPPTAQAGRH